eukprot:8647314-Alexandrium_andersonii.AAC.1
MFTECLCLRCGRYPGERTHAHTPTSQVANIVTNANRSARRETTEAEAWHSNNLSAAGFKLE